MRRGTWCRNVGVMTHSEEAEKAYNLERWWCEEQPGMMDKAWAFMIDPVEK